MPLLEGKTILITGASAGIGKACAMLFAREKARLLLCARREEKVAALCEDITKQHGIDCHWFGLDVRERNQVEQRLGSLPDEWKEIDVLVNNAGLSRGLGKIHEADLRDWEEMIDTNLKGLLYVSRAVIPDMVARKRGHIVNIGSIAGHEVYPGGSVYCATKHAVDAVTKGMQIDLVDTPLRVTSVDPGMVETEFSIIRFHGDIDRARKVYQGIAPLVGEDIAEAILFCITRPAHVNISQLRIMPTAQASAMVAHREE